VSDADPVTGAVPAAPASRRVLAGTNTTVLTAVAIGGVAGALLRYGATLLWPTPPAAFPWATWAVNTVGCAAIGVLMVVITALPGVHPLARPFFGTGVLGGFTPFTTYAVDAQRLLDAGRPGVALAYLAATMLAALGAVTLASATTRRALRGAPRVVRALSGDRR
jgi:CrcB protein